MKKIIFVSIVFICSLMLLVTENAGAAMEDYCVVPPYVIQNTPPNIMIVSDNSGSMFNYAYDREYLACPETTTSVDSPFVTEPAPGYYPFADNEIYVNSIDGFKVGQSLSLWDDANNHLDGNGDCSSCYWNQNLVITAIDPNAMSLTVSGDNHYLAGAPVVMTSCVTIPDTKQPGYTVLYDTNLEYYGYFNSNAWYKYDSNRFYSSGLKSDRSKASDEWDGNFLNWLTMRRVDVMKKVLTGGKMTSGEGAGFERLLGERPDYSGRGVSKTIYDAEDYMPISGTNQTRCIYSSPGSSNPARFYYSETSSSCSTSTSRIRRNVQVRVPAPVEGVLQSVVGSRARVGLSFYNPNTSSNTRGGKIEVRVDGQSLSSVVNAVNNKRPDSNTPLGETLWTVAGYFAQESTLYSGRGPRYQNGDFTINSLNDPYNYGTGGTPRYPKCAKSFVLYITDGEPCQDGDLPSTVLDYAQGRSNFNCGSPNSTDQCPAVSSTVAGESYSFNASTFPSCSGGNVAGMEDVALWAHTTDLRSGTIGSNEISDEQTLTTYVVFAFGQGSTLLKYTAINGGFEDLNGNNIPDLQGEWDNNGDGEPDTYYEATEGSALESSIRAAFSSMLERASSGTSIAVLSTASGDKGASMVQGAFYPRRRFGNEILSWSGVMQNLWFYIDSSFSNVGIREDTTNDAILNLVDDNEIELYFDMDEQKTKAKVYSDTDGDGAYDVTLPEVTFEDLNPIWEAGNLLWKRDLATDPRTIYTQIDGSSALYSFSTANAAVLAPYLDTQDENSDLSTTDDAEYIIRYIHGEDFLGVDRDGDGKGDFRSRTITNDGETLVWKLGDIINSTPRVVSWKALNRYHYKFEGAGNDDPTYGPVIDNYGGSTPCTLADSTQYITTQAYKDRDMVYVGGNDGMLHAFKLGTFYPESCLTDPDQKAQLVGSNLGREEWAFIPRNALPYLRYQQETDYCHIYTVDLAPFIFDASIGGAETATKTVSDWKTILIGGMRFGGGCRKPGTCAAGDDCVDTPISDPADASKGLGYSSYFALDITDENAPKLLWEFTNEELGYSTSGPAVVKTGPADENGAWFVVFGSGPTGGIDGSGYQFMGHSDQNLKLFVVDLRTGNLVRTIDTGIAYAFAGDMVDSTNDTDRDYQDDFLHFGYVKREKVGPDYFWTSGGVLRLVFEEDSNPANWYWNYLIDDIGPVTASIKRVLDANGTNKNAWALFGTGRYFFDLETEKDDPSNQRRIFSVKDTCVDLAVGGYIAGCSDSWTLADLTDVTSLSDVPTKTAADVPGFNGWYINLDLDGTYTYPEGDPSVDVTRDYYAERSLGKPSVNSEGCSYFLTFKPYDEDCAIAGKTFLWDVMYNTGGKSECGGMFTFQVSTGAIEEEDIDPGCSGPDCRKNGGVEGMAGSEGGLNISQPTPIKTILHKRLR